MARADKEQMPTPVQNAGPQTQSKPEPQSRVPDRTPVAPANSANPEPDRKPQPESVDTRKDQATGPRPAGQEKDAGSNTKAKTEKAPENDRLLPWESAPGKTSERYTVWSSKDNDGGPNRDR